jgi:hypothetical protein
MSSRPMTRPAVCRSCACDRERGQARLRDATERAWGFLGRQAIPNGLPPAVLSLDESFQHAFTAAEARDRVRRDTGADLGMELADEGFTAMLALALLPQPVPACTNALPTVLSQQIEACRWRRRYRFFPGLRQFAADTDCSAVAASALYEQGLLTSSELRDQARELLLAQAPEHQASDEGLHPSAVMVYWEDGVDTVAPPRGRKQDTVVCCNALYTLHLAGQHATVDGAPVACATFDLIESHLVSGRYLRGTRYYPSPWAFVYAASRLCTRSAEYGRRLGPALRRAVQAHPVRDALDLALVTAAADNVGARQGQRERRSTLAALQCPDGSWPAHPYFRLARLPVHFGSAHLTTAFALRALHARSSEEDE